MSNKAISMYALTVETVYTFVCSKTGKPTHIHINPLLEAVQRSPLVSIMAEFGGTLVDALEAGTLGVEEEHALKLPDEALDVPILVCQWGVQDHVIADGAHRLWRRWKRGDKDFPAYLIPERAWRMFCIEMPGDGAFWDNYNRTAKVRS